MTQGIYLNMSRPKSKKAIREALADPNVTIYAEATAFFGNEFEGNIENLPKTSKVVFAGPDPHSNRRFYGTIAWNAKGVLTVT